jgi:hypothetical protein
MKAQNATQKSKSCIKSVLIVTVLLLASVCSKAQDQAPFPYKGGSDAMIKFFKDSLPITPDMAFRKTTGTVVLKFSADASGAISRIVVYYADDVSLAQPAIDALNKTNHQWLIPPNRKLYDYLLSVTVYFNMPDNASPELKDAFYKFYAQRKQITAPNEVPLGEVTMLPNVVVTYDVQ